MEYVAEPIDEGEALFDTDPDDDASPSDVWRPAEAAGLLALDIDGTIVDRDGLLDPAAIDAVAVVQEAGVRVVLATGRSPWSGIDDLVTVLGLTGPQITLHGALISEPGDGEVHFARALSATTYLDLIRFAGEVGVDAVVATADGHRAERLPDSIGVLSPARAEGRSFRYVTDLAALAETPAFRVFLPTGPGRHEAVRRALAERFGANISIQWTDPTGVEVVAPGVDKGVALAWLASSIAVPMHRVCAVGDGRNDIGMLLRAGASAAMADATDEVRRAADIVVPRVEVHAVVAALRWFYPGLAPALDRVAELHGGGRLEPVLVSTQLRVPAAVA